jgi:hypothetical protein
VYFPVNLSKLPFQFRIKKNNLKREIYYLKHNECDVSEPEADNYVLSEPEAEWYAKEPVT